MRRFPPRIPRERQFSSRHLDRSIAAGAEFMPAERANELSPLQELKPVPGALWAYPHQEPEGETANLTSGRPEVSRPQGFVAKIMSPRKSIVSQPVRDQEKHAAAVP